VEVTEQELDKQIQQLVQQIDRTIGSAPPQKQDVAQAMQNMTPAQRIAAIRRNNDARR
jgi:peptidoglycan hydrolase CwlO-like protein